MQSKKLNLLRASNLRLKPTLAWTKSLAHNQAKELKEIVKVATKPPESLFSN